jgi:hypothetical protein
LAVLLTLNEEIAAQLRHQSRHLDGVRTWQKRFLIKAEACQLAKASSNLSAAFAGPPADVLETLCHFSQAETR